MSQMEPAFQNAGGVMETRTVKMGATRRTVKAPDGCATPRPSSPAKTQVETVVTPVVVFSHCYRWILLSRLYTRYIQCITRLLQYSDGWDTAVRGVKQMLR